MRTLIIGSGFVGRAIATRLALNGDEAVLASRRPPESIAGGDERVAWTPLDVTDRGACERTVAATDPDAVVLVHGPSDVTWCHQNPAEALHGHLTAARHVAGCADGRRVVLISTDNVFDGTSVTYDETAPTAPANAYGRAKVAAEQVVRDLADSTVLRVSLIYGWEPADSAKWLNFFASCAHRLMRGQPVAVPFDQWSTPVLVDDVSAVTAAVLATAAPPLLHLGGPDRISRADWARLVAAELGAAPALVRPEPRSSGRYADRPANTCLSSTLLATTPGVPPVRGVRDGARALLAHVTSQPGRAA